MKINTGKDDEAKMARMAIMSRAILILNQVFEFSVYRQTV
jgi:hypothetical protein